MFKKILQLSICTLIVMAFESCQNSMSPNTDSQNSLSSSSSLNSAFNQPNLGDRYYISSVLTSVFGQGSDAATIISQNITSQIDSFGGACDAYQSDCFNGNQFFGLPSVASLPAIGTVREVHKIRACDQLISQTQNGMSNALNIIYQGSTPHPLPDPTVDTITAAYEMFFVGQTPEQNMISSIASLAQALTEDSLTKWQFILTLLCHDPAWETP